MPPDSRGVTPVVGVVTLLACCVVAGSVLAVTVTDAGTAALTAPAEPVVLDVSAASDGTLTLTHRAGPTLDVHDLRVVVAVDGRPLRSQPQVPFVGTPGFDGAPAGPFNAATDSTWTAGERATLSVAGTNAPQFRPSALVTVQVYRNDARIAAVETRVTPASAPRERARAS
ncbi:type IV pilin [Halarchaeum sp. P4]|uniref:type IV pilin n=1 Tax=Halarchaeum sp. P4 TaxID=3421639 RepID=UPI003EB739FF